MAKASLLFPIICLLLSFALTGYIYRRGIAQAAHAYRRFHCRLVQRIKKTAKHTARRILSPILAHIDNANAVTGEYELVESSGLHPGVIITPPPDLEQPHSSDDDDTSTNASSRRPLSSEVRAILSAYSSDDEDTLWEIMLRSGWHARQSRLLDGHRHLQDSAVVDGTDDADITPEDWEIDRADRIDIGGSGAWVHRTVDRVVERLQSKLEAGYIDEVTDSA